ncbi:unnamed protein product [Phaedon cochleariae]|uniref:Receptor ligand binding region domain-containing protein n=1 Tax=Phaedon cochleariae TaxID=80249 RepID=A0A9P0GVN7_PHACE|nr:unnamed protein product [Phaedon cochleariae]
MEKEDIGCSVEQMRIAAEGHITTEALMWNQKEDESTISGMTVKDFRKKLDDVLRNEGYDIENQRYPEGYQEAPLAYDAVWSVALAFNKTMDRLHKFGKSLKDFNYNNKEIADDIYSAINSTQFLGVSGYVAFSSQGDRIALTQIEQVINGSYVVLGHYDTQADNLQWYYREVWQDEDSTPSTSNELDNQSMIGQMNLDEDDNQTVDTTTKNPIWTINIIDKPSNYSLCMTVMRRVDRNPCFETENVRGNPVSRTRW